MTASAWIALGFGAIGLALNLGLFAIGYGVLKGTVTALDKRIEALEAEMNTLTELKVGVAELKTAIGFMLEQFKDMNASIRWMREPAPQEPMRPAPRTRTAK